MMCYYLNVHFHGQRVNRVYEGKRGTNAWPGGRLRDNILFAVLNNVGSRRSCSSSGSSRPVLGFVVLNKGIHILRNIRNYSPTTKHTSPEDLSVFLYVNELNLLTRSCLQSE